MAIGPGQHQQRQLQRRRRQQEDDSELCRGTSRATSERGTAPQTAPQGGPQRDGRRRFGVDETRTVFGTVRDGERGLAGATL